MSGETETFSSNNLMGQWLSSIGDYSVEQVDYYPSGVTAFGIASTLICATWTDYARIRWPVLLYMSFCCTAAAVCILIWASPTAVKFLAYYLAGASYSGQATTFAWANQICADDNQERAVVLASMKLDHHSSFVPLCSRLNQHVEQCGKRMVAAGVLPCNRCPAVQDRDDHDDMYMCCYCDRYFSGAVSRAERTALGTRLS